MSKAGMLLLEELPLESLEVRTTVELSTKLWEKLGVIVTSCVSRMRLSRCGVNSWAEPRR
jgi:hypothetical protein